MPMPECPTHGPGCYGIPEECAWIEADIERRRAEGECFQCGALPSDYCDDCRVTEGLDDAPQPRVRRGRGGCH